MSKVAKIIVTCLVVFLFIVIFAAIAGARSDSGQTPGIFGLIAFAGLIGGIRAIWKTKSNDDNNDDSNSSILQK